MTPELGVCYYPEHWPEDQWVGDARQMVEMGLTWVRIGEFSWSRIEPNPDDFQWAWLDRAIEVLGAAGLKIVLGTPTATPPRWMVDKHPDMLAVDTDGRARKFGSRRHYCFSHEAYRAESIRITRLLAERYGGNPHIQAWQTDNEYGCHETTVSYSPAAESAFRIWLQDKYDTIDVLNAAWGNVFWSMEYNTFAQIALPSLTVTEPNPAHIMDFRRFSSDQVAAFNRAQCDALREFIDAPLIHNYMGRITDFDHFAVGADLEIASWDSYPLGFLEDRSDQGEAFKHDYQRQGDPDFQAFHHDLYRAVGQRKSKNGRWWVMEQQPGPVNWAPYNPAPLPGMVSLWTWEAIAHGAEVVSYFRWRQAPFGQEQMHAGLQRPDGTWTSGANEVAQVAMDLAALPNFDTTRSPVGLVFDYQSAWAWETQPQGQDFDYFRLVYDVYRGLRALGLSVDILPPDTQNFGDKRLVCIPGLYKWTPHLIEAVGRFDGQVLAGPRSGTKTPDFKTAISVPGLPNLDCTVTAVESLRPTETIKLSGGGHFRIWREFIETKSKTFETTEDGHPAIVTSGNVTYMAGWPDDQAMARIMESLCRKAGLETTQVSGGHRIRDVGDMRLHMNYGPNLAEINNITLGVGDVMLIDSRSNLILKTGGE